LQQVLRARVGREVRLYTDPSGQTSARQPGRHRLSVSCPAARHRWRHDSVLAWLPRRSQPMLCAGLPAHPRGRAPGLRDKRQSHKRSGDRARQLRKCRGRTCSSHHQRAVTRVHRNGVVPERRKLYGERRPAGITIQLVHDGIRDHAAAVQASY
jgi:hypothetical protein